MPHLLRGRKRWSVILELLKYCSKCEEVKATSDFHRRAGAKDGLACWCRQCKRKHNADRYLVLLGNTTAESKFCPDCETDLPADCFRPHAGGVGGLEAYCRECEANRRRARKYGLSLEEVCLFLQVPECMNPACRYVFQSKQEMQFDHCHDGNHFRGVLCMRCNVAAAGNVAECAARMRGLVDYLERDMERV